jgi:hypothetical protein
MGKKELVLQKNRWCNSNAESATVFLGAQHQHQHATAQGKLTSQHHTKTNNDDVVPARLLGGVPEPVASIKGKIVARWTKALTLRVGRA